MEYRLISSGEIFSAYISYVKCINKNEDIGTAVKLLISLKDYKDSAKIVAERSGEEE